ncbi:MAG: winged helix-turn-helix domain-containing protein [Promethearchaeota archaeon]
MWRHISISNNIRKRGNKNNDIESSFYYALGHEIRREILKIIGDNEFTSFTNLKKELNVSTGTIYHHLDTLSELIEQREDKKYYLTELGIYAYNSIKDNIESIKAPKKEFKSPVLNKLMSITAKRFIQFEKKDKIYTILISIVILILGTLFCWLNGFYSILLFYLDTNQSSFESISRFITSLSFIANFFLFFIVIEGISRIFYKNKENTVYFLQSFAIIQFPMLFYLTFHFIFKFLDLLESNIFNLIDKVLLIIFQVWSLWLLSYSLSVKKGLKIETSLIISLLLHYGGFTITLVLLV